MTHLAQVADTDPTNDAADSAADVLSIDGLCLNIKNRDGELAILNSVSLRVAPGRALGIVGESGSGKSMTANSILGLLPNGAEVVSGNIAVDGVDMIAADDRTKRAMRGSVIGTILQDPNASLNPVFRVGAQVSEPLRVHRGITRRQAHADAVSLLDRVGIVDPDQRARHYPHQFSGGMRQRIVGAAAIACHPKLIVADEPTTALDVTVQADYLELLDGLRSELDAALVFISHDLGVVARVCDDVAVMYAGSIVESAPTPALFGDARHPYTMGLISCLPSLTEIGQVLTPIPGNPVDPRERTAGCAFEPRCPAAVDKCRHENPPLVEIADGHSVACHRAEEALDTSVLWPVSAPQARVSTTPTATDGATEQPVLSLVDVTKRFVLKRDLIGREAGTFEAVRGVTLHVARGESVSIVGESGSGKTTSVRMALNLDTPSTGSVMFRGADLATLDRRGRREFRRSVQAVFQDPFTSLNPRLTIAKAVAEPLTELSTDRSQREIHDRVDEVLDQVGLDPSRVRKLYPHQMSGGQRQRVAIARSLSTSPDLLVLDEPVSGLDASIRVQVLNLLRSVQERTGVALLSISHDLGFVKYMSDRVAVMRRGEFVEEGTTYEIFHDPQHEYTRQLLDDAMADQLGAS